MGNSIVQPPSTVINKPESESPIDSEYIIVSERKHNIAGMPAIVRSK